MSTSLHFRVSPEVLGPLGLEQLQDPALAVLELIKNSWDADATRVRVVVSQRNSSRSILVADNGHGMNEGDFRNQWLVIGSSHKRSLAESEEGRPLIGEKGLGRLASFALGNIICVMSARESEPGFMATVDWQELLHSPSLEDYSVEVAESKSRKGTRISIRELKGEWSDRHTEFLISHAEFLASVPGQDFNILLRVDGKRHAVEDALATIDRLVEGVLELEISDTGEPTVTKCVINDVDEKGISFRDMKATDLDPRLAGVRLSLKFFLRDEATKRLTDVLEHIEVKQVLERYQGIRIFRDGINVPPYGLHQNDWAGLEKQRTSTGGPTLVPGNSQLVGEVHVSKRLHPHFIITAGRSGFADQSAVTSLANYVKWAAREIGTARRAERFGITSSDVKIPARVDLDASGDPQSESPAKRIRAALTQVASADVVKRDQALHDHVEAVAQEISGVLKDSEDTLRLYAQLASTGIAATSFAHELRADFDIVSEAVNEITTSRRVPDQELVRLLQSSWKRIRAFAALFKVIPVKLRRTRRTVSSVELRKAAKAVLGLAPRDKVKPEVDIPDMELSVVPAEIDSILLNLVSNAVKAIAISDNREKGRIRVLYRKHGDNLSIHVADNGVGVSPGVEAIMFEPLEGKFAEGTGMGLPIVRYIAGRYKGAVAVLRPSEEGFSTEFVVTLRRVIR